VKSPAAAVAIALGVLIAGVVWFFATQGTGRPVTAVVGSARHIVTLTLGSPRSGDQTVTVQVTDRDGNPYAAPSLAFTAVLPTMGYSSPAMTAVATQGAGHFTADGVELMTPGIWQFQLSLPDAAGKDQVIVPVSVTG
jgi:hypothetical protein